MLGYATVAVLLAGAAACGVLGEDAGASRDDGAAPPPPVRTGSPAAVEPADDADVPRGPKGTAAPLRLSRQTRTLLAEAARSAGGQAERIETGGTIYYGMVFGKNAASDAFYVVASIDRLYYWRKTGTAPWTYDGAFDARKCVPPVPEALIRSWGAADFLSPGNRCP